MMLCRVEVSREMQEYFTRNPDVMSYVLDVLFRFYLTAGESPDWINRLAINVADAINFEGPDQGLSNMHRTALLFGATNTLLEAVEWNQRKEKTTPMGRLLNRLKKPLTGQAMLPIVLRNNKQLMYAALVMLTGKDLLSELPESEDA